MQSLYKKLEDYAASDYYGFHMPGHKRNFSDRSFYQMDITEIDGFDDLHHPEELLKDAMDEMSQFYESDTTWILVNGSTCGILAALSAVTKLGDEILVARNCHKSVYHALFLRNLRAHYIYPDVDENFVVNLAISPQKVEEALQAYSNIKAFVMVSPTYEGIVSDIAAIAQICHSHKVALIVDQAHGAHFDFSAYFPQSALKQGADVVIESYHKTLPSLTQTAVMHLKSDLVEKNQLDTYVHIYQSSSPSYLLMGSILECFRWMRSETGMAEMKLYELRLGNLRQKFSQLSNIFLLNGGAVGAKYLEYDDSKIVFYAEGMSGHTLADILRCSYHLQMEMSSPFYVVAMTSLCDTQEGFDRFIQALQEIDKSLSKQTAHKFQERMIKKLPKLQPLLTSYESSLLKGELVSLEESVGKVAGEMIYVYPPGIPFVVSGEQITEEVIERMKFYMEQGYTIRGNEVKGKVKVHLF